MIGRPRDFPGTGRCWTITPSWGRILPFRFLQKEEGGLFFVHGTFAKHRQRRHRHPIID